MTAQQVSFPVMMVIKKNSVTKKKKIMIYLKVNTDVKIFFTLSHQKGGCLLSLVLLLSSKRKQKGHQNRKEQKGEKVEL